MATTTPSPPAKRREPLSRAEIARAAMEMVDRDGVDEFSMRRLATELGATTMAVYHYFQNKAEILQAAADQMWIQAVVAIEVIDDPVEQLVQGFLTTRRVFDSHADLTPYAFASPSTEEAVHVMALGIAEQFERAGFHGEAAGDAYAVLATYTFGGGLLHAERTMLDRRIRGPVSDLAGLAAGTRPEAGPTYHSVRGALGHDPDLERFERGLRLIVAGLVAQLAA